MSKIKNYDQDLNITLQDKVIGTDSAGNPTKNYSFQKIIDFLESQGVGSGTGDVSGKEDKINKVSAILGIENSEEFYPNVKALYDGLVAAVAEANGYTDTKLTGTAQDDEVVHLSGNETIEDLKTFTELLTAAGFKTPTGTGEGFLKDDGSIDYSPYITVDGIPVDESLVVQVTNKTGEPIAKGSAVYVNGAQGNKPTIALSIADPNPVTSQILGLAQTDISNNSNGYVVVNGNALNLNTSAFSDGDVLYLSASTPGALVSTVPVSPNHRILVGTVTRSHATQGSIVVTIRTAFLLDELSDVSASAPLDKDLLVFNESSELWENKSIADAGIAEDSNVLHTTGNETKNGKLAIISPDNDAVVAYAPEGYGLVGVSESDIQAGISAQNFDPTGDLAHFLDTNAVVVSKVTQEGVFEGPAIQLGDTVLDEKLLQLNNASLSTGLYEFSSGGLTNNSSTSFNIGPVKGWIVDSDDPLDANPIFIDFPGVIGQTTPYLLTAAATFVLIKPDNTPMLLDTRPTVTQRRDNIFLGVVGHPNGVVGGIGNSPDLIMNVMSQVRAMFEPIRFINGGIIPYANGATLALANTAGILYGLGIGFATNGNDAPSLLNIPAGAPTTFQYRTQIGTVFANTTLIEPTFYDLTGVRTAIPGSPNQATNVRIYLLQNGAFRLQYGQNIFSNLNNAIAGASTESFVEVTNNRNLGTLVGILSITKGCTNLSDTTNAKFLSVSKFGESNIAAAGIAIGTLQTAYKNSLIPQIQIDDTSGALTIKSDRASNGSTLLVLQNIAGTNTFTVNGNGGMSASEDAFINTIRIGRGAGNIGSNTVLGNGTLSNNVSSLNNTALGFNVLQNATSAYNTGAGSGALFAVTTGANNTGFGSEALNNISTTSSNTAIGWFAGSRLNDNTANTSSVQSNYLGALSASFAAGQTNETSIGYLAKGIGSNSVVLGNDSVTKTALKGNVIVGQTGTIVDTGEKLQVTGTVKATAVHSLIETNVQAGTTYILLATDNCKQIITTNSAAVTITIPTGLGTGFSCEVLQQGTGAVSFVGSGTTLRYSTFELPSIVEQYGIVGIDNIPNVTNEFHLYGGLSAI